MRAAAVLRALLLAAVAASAAAPLFNVEWFDSHEAASYPARLVEVGRCWAGGMPSARWFPDLAGGSGYPFLSFYAPLSFWTAGVVRELGAHPATAWKIVTMLATVAGAAGAYRLAREGLRPPGAFAAAALWAWAPYPLRDLWVRGDLAEHFALALLPWALWATLRLRRRPDGRAAVACAALGAATILSHNVLGLFAGLSMAACALPVLLGREGGEAPDAGRTALALAGAGAGALLLSAFFWVPALAERHWVQLENLRRGIFDVAANFVAPGDLLRLTPSPRVHVPGRAEPMAFELGVALVPAVLAPFALRRRNRTLLLVAAMLFGGGLLMATRLAAPLYEAVPLLRFVGFPWRFLGPASLGLALLGGAGVEAAVGWFPARRVTRAADADRPAGAPAARAAGIALPALVAAAAILASRDTARPIAPLELAPWMLDPAAYREAGFTASAADEYLPVWVRGRENVPFRGGLAAAGPARLADVERGVARWSFTVEAPDSVTIILQDWYYPGWKATLDGDPVAVEPRPGSGHAQLRSPPGRHRVVARLEPEPVRRAAAWVSATAAAAGLLVLRRPRRRKGAA